MEEDSNGLNPQESEKSAKMEMFLKELLILICKHYADTNLGSKMTLKSKQESRTTTEEKLELESPTFLNGSDEEILCKIKEACEQGTDGLSNILLQLSKTVISLKQGFEGLIREANIIIDEIRRNNPELYEEIMESYNRDQKD